MSFGAFPRETGSLIGFELEYVRTGGEKTSFRSYIRMFGGSLLFQLPVNSRGRQIYFSLGFGMYGETTADGRGSGEVGSGNVGGGVKITLLGPLKTRLDYRAFFLGDASDSSLGKVHRFPQRATAGISLAF